MPKVSEAHRVERRRQILDGARTSFARHGYEGATVARLEEATGLSRGAIFSYYPDKWELFYALALEDYQRIGTLWIEHGFEGILRHVGEDDPEWIGVYLEIGRMLRTDSARRERWQARNPEIDRQVFEHLAERQTEGVYRSDVTVEEIGGFLGIILDGLVVQAGAGFPPDVTVTLELVRSALAPK